MPNQERLDVIPSIYMPYTNFNPKLIHTSHQEKINFGPNNKTKRASMKAFTNTQYHNHACIKALEIPSPQCFFNDFVM
jgi:carbonic anhydrase